jgi:2'-5' RNA ligase
MPASDPTPESALAILVPKAERLVAPFRQQYDPSAAAGMPAHITLLYPFLPPDAIDAVALDRLRACVGRFAAFDFGLTAIGYFDPGVLYLTPEPGEPFRQLTLAIWQGWPQAPPYDGRFAEIIPHLTVAEVGDAQQRDRITKDFARAADAELPIRAQTTAATLLEKRDGRWRVHTDIRLGPRRTRPAMPRAGAGG